MATLFEVSGLTSAIIFPPRPAPESLAPNAPAWRAAPISFSSSGDETLISSSTAWLSPTYALIGFTYLVLNLAYSAWLKHAPIVDVMILASFYVLRVGAGVSLITVHRFSPWLYVFTTFLALYLGIGKRRSELTLLAEEANSHRRSLGEYTLPLLDQLILIVSGSAIITYCLYTFSAPNLPANDIMMLTIPFVIYGIFRYLYLLQVKHFGGEPEEVLLSDRPLQATIFLWILAVLIIFYIVPA